MKHFLDLQQKLAALREKRPEMKAKIEAMMDANQKRIAGINESVYEPKIVRSGAPTASTINLSGGNNMNRGNHPMGKYLQKQAQMLRNKLGQLEGQMNKEAALLKNEQAKRQNNIAGGGSTQAMMNDLGNLPSKLRPGNVGDINRVVWPFWFTTTEAIVNPNQAVQSNVTITQEAAFIWLSYTKAVYLEESGGAGQYQYVDSDAGGAAGKANGLSVVIRDSQSSRTFMNKPIDLNQVGYWKRPTSLPTPQLLLPNSNVEFLFQNNTNSEVYKPYITMFGLRVRIEHAKDILSTITG